LIFRAICSIKDELWLFWNDNRSRDTGEVAPVGSGSPRPPPRERLNDAAATGGAASAMKRLLLVDDDPAIVRFIRKVAEEEGYQVRAPDGPAGFFADFAGFDPTLLMLDLAMPDVDGIEIMRWLADRQCRTPIVIVSGFDRPVLDSAGHLGEARGLRIAAMLTKPVRLATLRELLKRPAAALGSPASDLRE
jgi:CheY-like chemotaxis protein